jgi:predicted GNAT family N-acyltransferase
MIEVKRFRCSDKILSNISNQIRTAVFVLEQKVDPELEYDHEDESHFYLLFHDGKPIATARWRETEMGIKLERFALLREFRNHGLGSELLKEVLIDVQKLDKKIYLHSQLRAVSYYEKAGFVKVGKKFTEAGIEHYLMELIQK